MRNIGEVVRIKTEEEFIRDLGSEWRRMVKNGWNEHMNKYIGKEFQIEGKYGNAYNLKGCGSWSFSEEMFSLSQSVYTGKISDVTFRSDVQVSQPQSQPQPCNREISFSFISKEDAIEKWKEGKRQGTLIGVDSKGRHVIEDNDGVIFRIEFIYYE